MNRESLSRAVYVVFAIACLGNGLWLLIDPEGWNGLLRMLEEDFGNGTLNLHLMRKMGAAYVCVGLAFFWCLANAAVRQRLHAGLTLFFALCAAINAIDILDANAPSHRWVTDAPFIFLPPVVLMLLMVPWPAASAAGTGTGRETGRVKWFDGKKGFGFIVREGGDEVFVHFRSIRGEGHRSLREGQQVSFSLGRGDKGPQAEDVTPMGDNRQIR